MKIRVYNAKAISAIVCIENYPTLIAEIFDGFLDSEYFSRSKNQNCINGFFEILNSLVDKHGQAIDMTYLLSRLEIYVDTNK